MATYTFKITGPHILVCLYLFSVHQIIQQRRAAIAEAMRLAGPADIVLIAGKGHEQGQIIGRGDDVRVLPFDDVTVARECVG